MNNSHQHENRHHSLIPSGVEGKLIWALIITIAIFFMEVIGGLISNSLALQSDAGHLFGDVLALGLSLFAAIVAKRPPTARRTYGYHRVEVFAAIFNGATLFALAGFIFYEAYQRLLMPQPVKSTLMLIIALIGLAANMLVLMKLREAAGDNLNVRAASLHVLGDMLGSVGVVAGGLIMLVTGQYIADPIISFFVGAIILAGAVGILKDGASILLESVPRFIKYDQLKTDMENINGVISIHDLHIWTISSANLALSAHVLIEPQHTQSLQEILQQSLDLLKDRYNIHHATLQLECECLSNMGCGQPAI